MRSLPNEASPAPSAALHDQGILHDFLSAIRSRLNVIGTSMYLLENSLEKNSTAQLRYIDKIKHELDVIRKLINE